MKTYYASTVILSALLASTAVHAQSVPSAADAGRQDQRFEIPASADVDAGDSIVVDTAEEDDEKKSLRQRQGQQFILQSITVDGSSIYSEQELLPLYAEYIGKTVYLADLHAIAERINTRYQHDGYMLTQAVVPSQEITGGGFRIKVIEGFVSDIRLEGEFKDSRLIASVIQQIKSMKPLNSAALEQALLLASDFEGMDLQAVLEKLPEDKAIEGGIGMVLTLQKSPYISSATADNHGSRYLGPYQSSINTGRSHIFTPFDKLSVTGAISLPYDELQFANISYRLPVNSYGTTLGLNVSASHSEPGYLLEPAEVEGKSYSGSISIVQSLLRSRKTNFSLNAALDIKNTTTDALGTELFDDKLRVIRLGAAFDRRDDWQGVSFLNATLSKGLDILGARETGSANLSRAEGHSDFTKVEASVARVQSISSKWSAFGVVSGQWADSPLLSSEEFGYGGASFGRAYDASEITGDHGIKGSLELRYALSPISEHFSLQPFIFYDIGKVWNRDTGGDNSSAASAGGGVRFNILEQLSGEFVVAKPLTKQVDSPIYFGGDDPRFLLSFTYRY